MDTKVDDTIQLCEVGDTFYKVVKDYNIKEIKITEVLNYGHYVYRDDYGTSYFNRSILKNCFKTREEAEKEVHKRTCIINKRELLKEYEKQLNEEFGLQNHHIIK